MKSTPFADAPSTTKSKSSLRSVYLRRLKRLLRLRGEHDNDLNAQGIRLLDRSIFAAYCDCLDVGAGDKARDALRNAAFSMGQFGAPGRGPA